MLKIHGTFFSTVPISSLKETHFSKKITKINSNIPNQADAAITKTLPFGKSKYSIEVNLQILNWLIDFILTSKDLRKLF